MTHRRGCAAAPVIGYAHWAGTRSTVSRRARERSSCCGIPPTTESRRTRTAISRILHPSFLYSFQLQLPAFANEMGCATSKDAGDVSVHNPDAFSQPKASNEILTDGLAAKSSASAEVDVTVAQLDHEDTDEEDANGHLTPRLIHSGSSLEEVAPGPPPMLDVESIDFEEGSESGSRISPLPAKKLNLASPQDLDKATRLRRRLVRKALNVKLAAKSAAAAAVSVGSVGSAKADALKASTSTSASTSKPSALDRTRGGGRAARLAAQRALVQDKMGGDAAGAGARGGGGAPRKMSGGAPSAPTAPEAAPEPVPTSISPSMPTAAAAAAAPPPASDPATEAETPPAAATAAAASSPPASGSAGGLADVKAPPAEPCLLQQSSRGSIVSRGEHSLRAPTHTAAAPRCTASDLIQPPPWRTAPTTASAQLPV